MIHVAIPAMNEAGYLPRTIECLLSQSVEDFSLWVCVNQPDSWWNNPGKIEVCENNRQTINYLGGLDMPRLHLLDHSSPGKGWTEKAQGVGHARKRLMDEISRHGSAGDIMVSLDADTLFGKQFLESVEKVFARHPRAVALSNPYRHPLTGDSRLDRAMLRYEIYMRYYVVNLWRIASPYSFTALGSAISLPLDSYRRIGGLTPKKSGEDFYFLQKLRKCGWVCTHNESKVYPGTRYSDRVFFGTGPALIRGSREDWSSYPLYRHQWFDQVKATCDLFPRLYAGPLDTPMTAFLQRTFGCHDPFSGLRENAASASSFVRACHQRIDGLRILQYLKEQSRLHPCSDEDSLRDFLNLFHAGRLEEARLSPEEMSLLEFSASSIDVLNKIRILLESIESAYQKNDCP